MVAACNPLDIGGPTVKDDPDAPAVPQDVNEALNQLPEAHVVQWTTDGLPMFIVGENIFPGAMQYDQLKKAVDDARGAKK